MMGTLLYKVEQQLYRYGFSAAPVRRLMAVQLLTALGAVLIGLPLALAEAWWNIWLLTFGIGAALAAFGFWHVARLAQKQIYQQFTRQTAVRMFVNFTIRLIFTGVILFFLIVILRVPLFPLLAGLTFTVASIVFWTVARAASNPIKES